MACTHKDHAANRCPPKQGHATRDAQLDVGLQVPCISNMPDEDMSNAIMRLHLSDFDVGSDKHPHQGPNTKRTREAPSQRTCHVKRMPHRAESCR